MKKLLLTLTLFLTLQLNTQEPIHYIEIALNNHVYEATREDLVTIRPMVSIEVKNTVQAKISQYELELLYMIVWAESGNQSVKGQAAVASVILNRLDSKYFPNDLEKVIYQGDGRQFNGVWRDEFGYYTDNTIKAVNQAIEKPSFDKDVVYFANVDSSSDINFIKNVILKNEVATIGDHTFSFDERIK